VTAKFLCSTAHPLVSGGTNSNRPTVAADLNETSLEAAVIQIAGWTDERGLLIAAQPKKLIVPQACNSLQLVCWKPNSASAPMTTTSTH
jgi:hypothetical protein